MKKYFLPAGLLLLLACREQNNKAKSDTVKTDSVIYQNAADNIPLIRDSVQQEPVQQYRVKTDNTLNDWYFTVRLYETPKTFHYLIKMQFEEVRGEDTLKLPNFGSLPRPVIKEGPEQYSCLIGFLDNNDQFREYKKVFVQGETLKITALKHYGVSSK